MSAISPMSYGSGLDTQSIVQSLVASASRPRQLLVQERSRNEDRLEVLEDITSKLEALETSVAELSGSATAIRRTVSVPEGAGFQASATGAAAAGAHAVRIDKLAQSEREASQGFADRDITSVGAGELKLTVAGVETVIDIQAGQDTLEGLQEAINRSGADVTASIVNTGTGATPYQLVITGNATGADQAVAIDVSGLTGGTALSFTQRRAAQDAELAVDGIDIRRSTNTVTDALEGITLELEQADAVERTFTVATDVEATQQQIQDVVDGFNAVLDAIHEQFERAGPEAESKPLSGDFALRSLERRMRGLLEESFGRPGSGTERLADIGIETSDDGRRLEVDSAKLEEALLERPDDVLDLFVKAGSATDAGVQVVTAGDTPRGTYAVEITQAAVRAEAVGAQAIRAEGLAQDEALTFTFGGEDTVVQLSAGDTIDDVVQTINDALDAAGVPVVARSVGGALALHAAEYGSGGSFSVVSDRSGATSEQTGIGVAPLQAVGQDVAGTIDGVAASGTGTSLFGDSEGPTPGLRVEVYGSDLGARGTVTVFGGFADELAGLVDDLTDPIDGMLALRQEGIEDQLDHLDDRIEREDDRLTRLEERLTRQYNALEQLLGTLNSQLSYLTATLSSE